MTQFLAFSPLVEHAIRTAIRYHDGQRRKCGDVPYISHLMYTGLLLQAYCLSEEIVIAAILHDIIEDTKYTVEELKDEFGEKICSIVLEVTENKHLAWEPRKAAYLEGIRHGSAGAKAVCCADKIHNLTTVMSEYRLQGDRVWSLFNRGREVTMDFYARALDSISHEWEHPLVDAYRAVLREAQELFPQT
jgi:(p)ppGpp synthase/HD superfamily hydrolase